MAMKKSALAESVVRDGWLVIALSRYRLLAEKPFKLQFPTRLPTSLGRCSFFRIERETSNRT